MKKVILILACFLTALIMSCGGGSEAEGGACESSFDCPLGQTCSSGRCVKPGSADDGSGEGESGSEDGTGGDGNNQGGGNSGGHDGDDQTDDGDVEYDEGPITGNCEPGKVQKCGYQGDPVTENVGPCKSAERTCKEDGTWGKCEGAVEPVYETGEELCTNGIDDDCDGEVDNKKGSCIVYWGTDDTGDTDTGDSGVIDVGYTGDYGDAYQLPIDAEICNDTCIPMKAECLSADIDEGASELCNQVDDDCDGIVDEGCPCSPGQTQSCFLGPKNYRNIGTCQDGVQTCKVTNMRATQGKWGECVGGIAPSLDKCDNADNNCNGCKDDKLCCQPPIDCSFDIGDALPFADKTIDGTQIYDTGHKFNDAGTATWEWSLSQGPCDIVLNKVNSYMKGAKTQGELGSLAESDRKILLSGVGLSQLKLRFRLSGQYTLHLKVTRENGEVHECSWIIRVVADGLRIELCWDTTGDVDIDLHMGKNTGNQTTSWEGSGSSGACYYSNMKPGWGYAKTDNYNKNGVWTTGMNNPRLDMDNIWTVGEPENINVDNPGNGDTFRVLVRHFSSNNKYPTSSGATETHPVVNVYCGGTLKATYGNSVPPTLDRLSGFNTKDDSWKLVEIKWVDDGRGYKSDACELTPRWNDSTGYVVNPGSVPAYTDAAWNQ